MFGLRVRAAFVSASENLQVAVLDPRVKARGLELYYDDDYLLRTAITQHISDLEVHFKEHYAQSPSAPPVMDTPVAPQTGITGIASRLSRQPSQNVNELASYLSAPSALEGEDPLAWWKTNAAVYPKLSKLARNILAIPGTSRPVLLCRSALTF